MTRRSLIGLFTTLGVIALFAATAAARTPQTTTQQIKGAATVTTETLKGEVVKVEGNTLVVKMSTGGLRTFSDIPDSRKAIVDGKEVGVRDLQPGTKLTATITKTMTPITVRTTTVANGTVWYVAGTTVILQSPSGENKQYNVNGDQKFTVNGQPATVFDLRQGMVVSAEKIVEEPKVEFATDTKVVGQAPAPMMAPAAQPKSASSGKASSSSSSGTSGTNAAPASGAAPSELPKTGDPVSPIPLMGLLGLLCVGGALALRRVRRA
jgi:LPXTG-motif cell wall-anchored protein